MISTIIAMDIQWEPKEFFLQKMLLNSSQTRPILTWWEWLTIVNHETRVTTRQGLTQDLREANMTRLSSSSDTSISRKIRLTKLNRFSLRTNLLFSRLLRIGPKLSMPCLRSLWLKTSKMALMALELWWREPRLFETLLNFVLSRVWSQVEPSSMFKRS